MLAVMLWVVPIESSTTKLIVGVAASVVNRIALRVLVATMSCIPPVGDAGLYQSANVASADPEPSAELIQAAPWVDAAKSSAPVPSRPAIRVASFVVFPGLFP